jgi:hypothetical protein
VPLRVAASLTLITLLPVVSASAQFTTYVAPPPKQVDSTTILGATGQPPISADSAQRLAITNMKAWVDSAAGEVTGRHLTASDSVAEVGTTTTTTTRATTTFRDGSRAPNTATPLPTLALFGSAALAVGVLLLRRERA